MTIYNSFGFIFLDCVLFREIKHGNIYTNIDGVDTIIDDKKRQWYIELAILFFVQFCGALGGFMPKPIL